MREQSEKLLKRIQFLHSVGRVARASDISVKEVEAINELFQSTDLVSKDGVYYLPKYSHLVELEPSYTARTQELMDLLEKYKFVFNCCPFVKDIALCNTLSQGVPKHYSDIDLFIILDFKRFFLARLLLSGLIHLSGVRRHHAKIKDRFCLSFYVSDKNLDFSELLIEDDVYFHYWFYYLKFLYGNHQVQSSLVDSNVWFKESDFVFENLNLFTKNFLANFIELVFGSFLFGWLEKFCKKLQLKRAMLKNAELDNPKGVVIKDGLLKFHVVDIREDFRDKFYRSFPK